MMEKVGICKFNFRALVFLFFSFVLLLGPVAGTVPYLGTKARIGKCLSNHKQIGIALTMWRMSSDGTYPPAALPWFARENEIAPWPEILAMEGSFSIARIEAGREALSKRGVNPDNFVKTVDNLEIFKCPADNPHPHAMNEARAKAGKFWREKDKDGYGFSSGLSAAGVKKQFAKDVSSQVLAADGAWYEIYNFSAAYVDDPKAKYDQGGDECNRMGYFHAKAARANVVFIDGSVKTVNYGLKGAGIDTKEAFFLKKGEALTEKY